VITTEGSIISKTFIEGEQLRGGVTTPTAELITAAEREATDALNDRKIPQSVSQRREEILRPASPRLRPSGGDRRGPTQKEGE